MSIIKSKRSPNGQTNTATVSIRLTAEEKALIIEHCYERRISMSTFMVPLAMRELGREDLATIGESGDASKPKRKSTRNL